MVESTKATRKEVGQGNRREKRAEKKWERADGWYSQGWMSLGTEGTMEAKQALSEVP